VAEIQRARNDWGLGGKEFLPARHGLESHESAESKFRFWPAGADFSCRGISRDAPPLKIH
jgi:hypothetical protein